MCTPNAELGQIPQLSKWEAQPGVGRGCGPGVEMPMAHVWWDEAEIL